jgi:hypothetical protein
MRVLIAGVVAVAGLIASAALVQAAPIAFHDQAAAAPAITLVVQRCGHGFHREAATPDKAGVWHGHCAPNAPKKQPDAATPLGSPQSLPRS